MTAEAVTYSLESVLKEIKDRCFGIRLQAGFTHDPWRLDL